jgi:hypothetical protein
MELQTALSQIDQIHRQMAQTRMFRGYRALTTLFTGIAAIAAALWQAWTIPDPASNPYPVVNLWVSVAIACLVGVGAEIYARYRHSASSLQRELTLLAIEQFLPCIVVGGLVTLILAGPARKALWMLSGLWTIFFGLGILASRRLLPGAIVFVGAFYLLCGLLSLALAQGGTSFSPWIMGIPFGIGQIAAAIVLHASLERNHAS